MDINDSYYDFLEQRKLSPLPTPMQLRRWARDKVFNGGYACRSPYCECATGKAATLASTMPGISRFKA